MSSDLLQTSNGTDVRSMEPGFLQETLSPGDQPKEKSSRARTVTWLCLPYFCLPGCSAVLSTSRPDSHPMQTLLQAQHSLGQTVSKVPSTPTGSCLHIAQIWCLILDDCKLLRSCSRFEQTADAPSSFGHLHANTYARSSGRLDRHP